MQPTLWDEARRVALDALLRAEAERNALAVREADGHGDYFEDDMMLAEPDSDAGPARVVGRPAG